MEIYFLAEKKRELSRQLKEYEGEGSSEGRKNKEDLEQKTFLYRQKSIRWPSLM